MMHGQPIIKSSYYAWRKTHQCQHQDLENMCTCNLSKQTPGLIIALLPRYRTCIFSETGGGEGVSPQQTSATKAGNILQHFFKYFMTMHWCLTMTIKLGVIFTMRIKPASACEYECVCVYVRMYFSYAHVGFILIVNTTTHSRHCTNRNAGHYCYTRLLHMNLMFCGPCIVIICAIRTNRTHYLLSIYLSN
jgi:hypothetical protein